MQSLRPHGARYNVRHALKIAQLGSQDFRLPRAKRMNDAANLLNSFGRQRVRKMRSVLQTEAT